MIVYFTGTGNSRYCAEFLAHTLGDEAVDSFRFIRDGIQAELVSEKPWVLSHPPTAGNCPISLRIFSAVAALRAAGTPTLS